MKRARVLLGVALVSLLGVLFAGYTYRAYRETHLRKPPRIHPCVHGLSIDLAREKLVSGVEIHIGAAGEMVYLTAEEDDAVGCAGVVDAQLGKRMASALAEASAESRGRAFVELVKSAEPGPAGDRRAYAAQVFGSAAMKAFPRTPATRAITDELDLLHGCRFDTATPCPSRPPAPRSPWIIGVPAALGVVTPLVLFLVEGVRRLVRLVKRRRNR